MNYHQSCSIVKLALLLVEGRGGMLLDSCGDEQTPHTIPLVRVSGDPEIL